jgi:NAD(P)-dependent dehydrogenase (short-subunit alcohol dehydrogenase family)
VALITGASRGIGRAIGASFASAGFRVVLNYRTHDAAALNALERLEAGGAQARAVRADVGQCEEARRLVDDVLAVEGRIDVLVNNAAVQRVAMIHEMCDADWHDVMNTNLNAAFYLSRAVLPGMIERKSGVIVNVASASAFMGQRGAGSYVVSKHGLIGLTRTLALEVAPFGVLVNAVAPGLTDTDTIAALTPMQRRSLLSLVPLRRIARPEEVAEMVLFVATRARYSTGNVFHVGGGAVM